MAITVEIEILCQRLKLKGMYSVPLPQPSTAGVQPNHNVHFQPINPAPKSPVQPLNQGIFNPLLNLVDDSPRPPSSSSSSSIPCGQPTPQGSTQSSNSSVHTPVPHAPHTMAPPTPYINQAAINQHTGNPALLLPRVTPATTAFRCNVSQLTKALTGVEYASGPHHYKPKGKPAKKWVTEEGKPSKETPPKQQKLALKAKQMGEHSSLTLFKYNKNTAIQVLAAAIYSKLEHKFFDDTHSRIDVAMAFRCNMSQLTKALTGIEYASGPHHYKPKGKPAKKWVTEEGKPSKETLLKQQKLAPKAKQMGEHPTTPAPGNLKDPDKAKDTLESESSSSDLPPGL